MLELLKHFQAPLWDRPGECFMIYNLQGEFYELVIVFADIF